MPDEAINHAKLAMLFRREFQLCNVQKGETIVLLSDLGARRDYVSAAFAAGEDLGADAYEMCVNAMPSWTKVGVETVGRCFAGNFLFSTGPNSQGGGKRTTKGHYDVPMRDCTVSLDNDAIIDRGHFAGEKMRVTRMAR